MAMPTPNLLETSIKSHKTKEHYYHKAKGMSFFASLLSIFVYMSIFYIFNLSPSSLFTNTKFWFFISNTLIFIIAADYNVFSSSDGKRDSYEEYVKFKNNTPSFVAQYPEMIKTRLSKELVISSEEGNKEIVAAPKSETPEKIIEIVKNEDSTKDVPRDNSGDVKLRRVGRSKSERYRRVKKKKINVLRSSETEKHKPAVEEKDDLSSMPDEELNRRFEEFIQRFNRQIRLQRESNLGQED